jgi:hypothetical protein
VNFQLADLPHTITFQERNYALQAITYSNGAHFNADINLQEQWHHYDGRKEEYHVADTGLQNKKYPTL